MFVTPYIAVVSSDTFFLVTIGWLYWEIGVLFGDIR